MDVYSYIVQYMFHIHYMIKHELIIYYIINYLKREILFKLEILS